jgi:hypothetical protein
MDEMNKRVKSVCNDCKDTFVTVNGGRKNTWSYGTTRT